MNSELVSIRRLMSPLNAAIPTSALLHDPSAARSSDFVSPFACIFMAFFTVAVRFPVSLVGGALGHAWRAPARRRNGRRLGRLPVPPTFAGVGDGWIGNRFRL